MIWLSDLETSCTVVFWKLVFGQKCWKFQQISNTIYYIYVGNLVRFGANKISLEMGALSMLEFLFFKKQMDQKWNFHPLFAIFRENQVATWKSWLFFHWLSWVGSRKYKNLLKLSYYDYTNGRVLSVTTSLHGFLLAFRLHNLKVPGSNPVGSKKNFFSLFLKYF